MYVRVLEREGRALATAAETAGSDAEVPNCPGWQIRDLLRHTGTVHRWATAFVAEGHTSYHPDPGLPDLDGEELLAWFREGHGQLVDTLSSAAPDVECWHFLPAPRRWRSGPGARRTRRPCTGSTPSRPPAPPPPGSTTRSPWTASRSCCSASTPAPRAGSAAGSRAGCGCG